MINYLKLFLVTLVAFFAIDMLWLGLIARSFYRKHLGFIMAPTTNWTAAIIFYLLFILGILVFVVVPGLQQGQSLQTVLIRAALYGLVTYATYDLTNLATLKDWPVFLTIVDMTWGTVLSLLVSYISFTAGKLWF
jgi:uncharacterized membrane protein